MGPPIGISLGLALLAALGAMCCSSWAMAEDALDEITDPTETGRARVTGRVLSTVGAVEVRSAQYAGWTPIAAQDQLAVGDSIRTGRAGRVTLLLEGESLVRLNERSTLSLVAGVDQTAAGAGDLPSTAIYRLDAGEAWLLNNNPDAKVRIQAADLVADLLGTEISWRVASDRSVSLSVLDGLVRVASNDPAFAPLQGRGIGAGEGLVLEPGAVVRTLTVDTNAAVQWIVTIPALFRFRDFTLVSGDRVWLRRELAALEAQRGQDVDDRLRAAEIRRDLGETEAAAAAFADLLLQSPGSARAATGLGWCRLDAGQVDAALRVLDGVDTPLAALARAAAYVELDRLLDAEFEIAEGLTRYPAASTLRVQDALILLERGQLQDAWDRLRQLTGANPDDVAAWRALALSAVLVGRPDEALAAALHAVDLAPNSPASHVVTGYVHQALFELDTAIASNNAALALDGDNLTALVNLAELQFGSNRLEAAIETVGRAATVKPDSARVRTLQGFIALAERDMVAAETRFAEAKAIDPGLADPYLGLALTGMRQGLATRALEDIAAAVALGPRRSLHYTYWGKLLYEVERFGKAARVFERAAELDPEDPTPIFHQAIIHRDNNRAGAAIRTLNRAVGLNDNRAVYRSRYLLDRDLATKNVDLSLLFDQLDLSAWSQSKALAAVRDDFLNHQAHLNLAGALDRREDRSFGFAAETLLGRLLQPANVNTFNSFNDYTSFVERPELEGSATISLGNFERRDGQLLGSFAWPDADLAGQIGYVGSYSEGWRTTNFERLSSLAGVLKWQASRRDGLLFAASRTETNQADLAFPRFSIDAESSPADRSIGRVERLEIGWHRHLGAGSDLLVYLARLRNDGIVKTNTFTPITGLGVPARFLTDNTVGFDRPFFQAQTQYMRRLGRHQLFAGLLAYRGENDADNDNKLFFQIPSTGVSAFLGPPFSTRVFNGLDTSYTAAYAQDTWRVHRELTLEGALYFDRLDNSDPVAGTEFNLRKFSPRFGAIWTPTRSDTVRAAWFEYVLPFISARVDPTNIAGVPVFRNAEEGAVQREAQLVWEREWATGFASASGFMVRKTFTDAIRVGGRSQQRKRKGWRRGIELEVNQLLSDRLGLAAIYRALDTDDQLLPQVDRDEHLVPINLRYRSPNGFSAGLGQTYRHLDLEAEPDREHIFNTDVEVGYDFPDKRGAATLTIHNLFDSKYNWVTDRFILDGEIPAFEVLATIRYNF